MKNVLTRLAKSALGSTAVVLEADGNIQNKIFGSGMTVLINSKQEMDMKIIKSFEESGLLIKVVSKTIKNEVKKKQKQKKFLGMLLSILAAGVLWNMLIGWVVIRAGKGVIEAGEGAIAANQGRGTMITDQDF